MVTVAPDVGFGGFVLSDACISMRLTWRVVKNSVYLNGFDGENSVSLLPKSRCWDSTSSVTNSCGKMLNSP